MGAKPKLLPEPPVPGIASLETPRTFHLSLLQ